MGSRRRFLLLGCFFCWKWQRLGSDRRDEEGPSGGGLKPLGTGNADLKKIGGFCPRIKDREFNGR